MTGVDDIKHGVKKIYRVCVQKYFSICKYFSDRGEKSLDSVCLPCYIVYMDNIVNSIKGENIMAKYSYIRVSSKDQHEDRQLKELENQGITPDKIFVDKQSGKDFSRPEYQKMISILQKGDVIYIHSIDRLGRNYDEIIANWQMITKEIKADIIVLDMPLLNTTVENSNLTGKFIADLVLQILSYVAETERNNIRKRQAEGIAIAKEKGVYAKKEYDKELLERLKAEVAEGKTTVVDAAKQLGISRAYWYRLVR